jgi:hypothetical protein
MVQGFKGILCTFRLWKRIIKPGYTVSYQRYIFWAMLNRSDRVEIELGTIRYEATLHQAKVPRRD